MAYSRRKFAQALKWIVQEEQRINMMSLSEFCKRAGVSRGLLSKYLGEGTKNVPHWKMLQKILFVVGTLSKKELLKPFQKRGVISPDVLTAIALKDIKDPTEKDVLRVFESAFNDSR